MAAVELGMDPATGDFIIQPTLEEQAASPLLMTLAGTAEGVLMIEGAADFLTEAQMIDAVKVGQGAVTTICKAVATWAEEVGKPKKVDSLREVPKALKTAMEESQGERVYSMLQMTDPNGGNTDTSEARKEMDAIGLSCKEEFGEKFGEVAVRIALKKLCSKKMRELVHATGRRCDGRPVDQVRPISIDTRILPQTHGSALFTRGATQVGQLNYLEGAFCHPVRALGHLLALSHQAIATATLGTADMNQRGENMLGDHEKRFYLQYTFPPSSVGEVGRVGAPGRREVGHGNLAERALVRCIPSESDFPYSMRVESLITESSGSSSMARY